MNVTSKNTTLCLCMIVKNESKIITRMFDSVISIIDTYCICDTGSDDNTIIIIKKYFDEKGINGIIIEEPFINFCYNRNFALDKCNGMSDYILLMDADMKLEIKNFNKSLLNIDSDVFHILQGNDSFYYPNKRIIRNNGRFKYYGVTHEYIIMDENEKTLNIDKNVLFINDVGDGGSKDKKFERDIVLLKQGIIDEPENTRYYFYLGNSYKDSGNYVNAIVQYKKLLEFENAWVQEKYISCIRIYESYATLGKEQDGIYYLIESYKYDNIRIEGIYRLIKYYCIAGQDNIAYTFYNLIQDYYENHYLTDNISNKLFLNVDEYEFYLPYYMIIVSERLRKYDIGIKMYEIIFKKEYSGMSQWWIDNFIFNLQFFVDKVGEENSIFFRLCEKYINKIFDKVSHKSKELIQNYEKYGLNLDNILIFKKKILPFESFIGVNNVFLYWIGKDYSLISLLRKIIYAYSKTGNGYNIHFITPDNLEKYINNIPDCFNNLWPAYQADFIRANVICDYGGIWLDSDTLILENIDSLFNIINEDDGFFIKESNLKICNGIFGSKLGTKLMMEYKKIVNEIINEKKTNIYWNEIGCDLLQNIYENTDYFTGYKIFNGLDNLYPVNWNNCVEEFIDKPYDNYKTIIREYQPLLVLVNSVYKKLENYTENEILENDKIPLNYFLRKSITNYVNNSEYPNNNEMNEFYQKFLEKNNLHIFNNIYKNNIWNENNPNIPLSGPGSSLENTKDISKILNDFIYSNNVNSILDLGCGDLTWISKTDFFNDSKISYTGIDIVEFLINEHKIKYPNKNFYVKDIVSSVIEYSDIIIIRDVLFHLKNNDIISIFKNIKNKCKFIAITSCNNLENTDIFNKYHFSEKNIHITPFNINNEFLQMYSEFSFNRQFYIYSHNNFFKNFKILDKKSKYIILADWLTTFIDMTVYIFCKNLEKYGWEIILLSNLNIEKIKSKKSIILCVTLDSFDISLLKCNNIKLLYLLCDLHPYNEIKNKCIENTDIILGCFTYLFPQWKNTFKSIIDKPNYWLQGCSIKNYFNNINFRKDPVRKIFVSGYSNDTYPFRNYMLNLSKENNNIETLNHPSYDSQNRSHNIVHQTYYKKLNEYLCCFTDALCWNYIVSKVFEITAVGSLLLVQDSIEKQLNELEFFDGINCIMCNQDNVISKIEWIMDEKNREKVDEIRMKGMILTREKHNSEIKAELFNKYVDGLANINL